MYSCKLVVLFLFASQYDYTTGCRLVHPGACEMRRFILFPSSRAEKCVFKREEEKESGDIITVHPIPGHAPRLRAADSGVGVGLLTRQDRLTIHGNLTIYLPRLTWVGTTLESNMHKSASRLTFRDVQLELEPVDAHLILLNPEILSSGVSVNSSK